MLQIPSLLLKIVNFQIKKQKVKLLNYFMKSITGISFFREILPLIIFSPRSKNSANVLGVILATEGYSANKFSSNVFDSRKSAIFIFESCSFARVWPLIKTCSIWESTNSFLVSKARLLFSAWDLFLQILARISLCLGWTTNAKSQFRKWWS